MRGAAIEVEDAEGEEESYPHLQWRRRAGVVEIGFATGESNAIAPDVLRELGALLDDVSRLDDVHCAMLYSAQPGVFSRGLDVRAVRSASEQAARKFLRDAEAALDRLGNVPMPVFCLIDGDCLGAGLEIALRCDVRIATEHARFAAPEVIFGMTPTAQGIARLASLVGSGQTARLLLTGTTIDAREALAIGLVEDMVPRAEMQRRSAALGDRLSRISSVALASAKRQMRHILGTPLQPSDGRTTSSAA